MLLINRLLLCLICTLSSYSSTAEPFRPDEEQLMSAISQLFPEATEIKHSTTEPPYWPVYQVTSVIGYAYLSADYVQLPAFSGAPYQLLVGINTTGEYRGLQVLDHHEPIFLHGLGPEPMYKFTDQYPGLNLKQTVKVTSAGSSQQHSAANQMIDGITKATVSAVVLNETVMLSALQAAQQIGLIPRQQPAAKVRTDYSEPLDWSQLTNSGMVSQLNVDKQQLATGFAEYNIDTSDTPEDDQGNIASLYYAYLNVPSIGNYLLGETAFNQLIENELKEGEHAIAVFSNGPYGISDDNFVPGTPPDRLMLTQGGSQIELKDTDFFRDPDLLSSLQTKLPQPLHDAEEIYIYRIKAAAPFDPASKWRLSLLFKHSPGYLRPDVVVPFNDDYRLDKRFFIQQAKTANTADPLWLSIWKDRIPTIAILVTGLAALTLIIFNHSKVTANANRFKLIRAGFLVWTLVFIGYLAQGQLSVTNLFTILKVIGGNTGGQLLLMDPVIFILWCYVLLTLVIWGRGYFCGWLCPFGILQDMAGWLGERKLRLKQIKISNPVHHQLWRIKYVLLVVLIAMSYYDLNLAEQAAEIEPFKTAITMNFIREWPFVFYGALLLIVGLYLHKPFCRYLCPLGASFAVLGRFHILKWLPRRDACGSPCKLCNRRCGINAIHMDGRINYNECIQCLECEVIYQDDHQCVPLINARKGKRKPKVFAVSG